MQQTGGAALDGGPVDCQAWGLAGQAVKRPQGEAMKKLFVIALAAVLAGPAMAGDLDEALVAQLQDQGYSGITVGHTLLGRLRIVAQRDGMQREIVVNPYTGEILRDYLSPPLVIVAGAERDKTSQTTGATTGTALGVSTERNNLPDLVDSADLSDEISDATGGSE